MFTKLLWALSNAEGLYFVKYDPLHIATLLNKFLASDWLYSLWHVINARISIKNDSHLLILTFSSPTQWNKKMNNPCNKSDIRFSGLKSGSERTSSLLYRFHYFYLTFCPCPQQNTTSFKYSGFQVLSKNYEISHSALRNFRFIR